MERSTDSKGLGVWRETPAGRRCEFGGKHWQEGVGSLEGKPGRKEPGVWRETLAEGAGRLEVNTDRKELIVWREN